jgi:hypothetical protein
MENGRYWQQFEIFAILLKMDSFCAFSFKVGIDAIRTPQKNFQTKIIMGIKERRICMLS